MLKLLLKRNLLENVTIISSLGTLICILLNYVTNISLITGVWFPLYIISLFIISIFGSFKFIQWLLNLNRPITCDIDNIVKKYPYLSFIKRVLPVNRDRKKVVWKEYDTNELSVISSVLERKLVSSWYVPFISQEISFPFACKQMLDQMIGKTFQICSNIESRDVFLDISAVLITHLNEYKKAQKKQQKSPTVDIDTLYKKSHAISEESKKYTSVDHCTNILRIMIKELLPWELWDTPHSELLVRILSRKLDMYIEQTLVDPVWLNDRLVTYLTGKDYVDAAKKVEKTEVLNNTETNEVEKETPPVVEENVVNNVQIEEPASNESNPVVSDVKSSPVMRQKRGRQGRNEVKIYDRIIEGSVKTWETDMDLQCISLGQDLLASLDGEITLSRLWGQDGEPESSPERVGGKSPQPLWFGVEDMEIEIQEPSQKKGQQSPKAADAILKDIQSTVNQAKNKIGDLQVRDVDLRPSDEAAGMMEGLLDFGIAGLKKGLRFTGLSDDAQEKSPSHIKDKGDKSPPENKNKASGLPIEHTGTKDEPNGVPILTKQQRVISQDSVPIARPVVPSSGFDSPEPQYEEAADLSTSIAKLRCLLRQRAEAMPRNEDVWWESAEETRGRTQNHPSSRPVDTATLADEFDMNMDRNTSPNQTSNNMQRLDKLFHRTVTGVFNSLKTAVGGEEEAPPALAADNTHLQWAYVAASPDINVCACAGRAVGWGGAARVDAALDSLAHAHRTHARTHPRAHTHTADELDEWLSEWCARFVCACGGAGAVGLCRAHVALAATSAILAEVVEDVICEWLANLSEWLRRQIFVLFEKMSTDESGITLTASRPIELQVTKQLVVDKLPVLVLLFGEQRVSQSVELSLSSISHKSINRDVVYRALDLLVYRFKTSTQNNASFDN